MNGLQIFDNPEFGQIRTIEENGKVLFCGSDVAKALGYSNPYDAMARHCKKAGIVKREGVSKTTNQHGVTTDQINEMKYIDEGNLYRLITHSKLPSAERFESWVFDEVLPSIRKHGMYARDELLDNPDLLIEVATQLKREREQRKALESKVKQDAPKVLFADAVAASNTLILIGELAKILRQNSVDIGRNRLFKWLREKGYLSKRNGTDYNAPTQRAMELGLFEVKETAITHSDGHVTVNKTTKVTGKGQQYFINLFLGTSNLA